MDKKQRTLLIQEYDCGGKSYRILARKYGVSLGYISKVIRSNKEYRQKQAELEAAAAAKKTARRKKTTCLMMCNC